MRAPMKVRALHIKVTYSLNLILDLLFEVCLVRGNLPLVPKVVLYFLLGTLIEIILSRVELSNN